MTDTFRLQDKIAEFWATRPRIVFRDEAPNELAALIRARREELGLSQEEVDAMIHAKPGYTARRESGETTSITGAVWWLAQALGVTPADLHKAAKASEGVTHGVAA